MMSNPDDVPGIANRSNQTHNLHDIAGQHP